MLSHPYLIVFVKIYWNYVSPRGSNPKDRSLLHFIGEFPKVGISFSIEGGFKTANLVDGGPALFAAYFKDSH